MEVIQIAEAIKIGVAFKTVEVFKIVEDSKIVVAFKIVEALEDPLIGLVIPLAPVFVITDEILGSEMIDHLPTELIVTDRPTSSPNVHKRNQWIHQFRVAQESTLIDMMKSQLR